MTNLPEIWTPIGIAPNYEISTFGFVRNSRSKRVLKGCLNYRNGKPLKIMVYLHRSEVKGIALHRLMIQYMPPQPSDKHTIDHKDRNPFNNKLDNLRWATQKQQQRNKSNAKPMKKISMEELDAIFHRTDTETLSQIGKEYGISKSDLSKLLMLMHPSY